MTTVLRRSLVAFATALALVAIAAVPGVGSATFSTAVDLSLSAPGQNADDPQVAVGPDGATTITWSRSNGTNEIIQAATRPAGSATFSAAVDLSAPLQSARDPQVAVGPDGATTITWYRYNGTHNIIQTSPGEPTLARLSLTTKAGRTALRSRVTLPGPGVLSQRARSTGSKRVRVCATKKTVSRASTVWVVCPLTRAAKRALLQRSLRVRVITTFTPTGGVAQVRTKIIRLGARRATTAGTG